MKHNYIKFNVLKMHYVTAGKGPLLLILHGFPESWEVWKPQMHELSKHYTLIIPDLVGFNLSDKPKSHKNYTLEAIMQRLVHHITQHGKRAHIVGHDLGGILAWHLAMHHNSYVNKLLILNAPHPYLLTKGMMNKGLMHRGLYTLINVPIISNILGPKIFPKVLKDILGNQQALYSIFAKSLSYGKNTKPLEIYRSVFRRWANNWDLRPIKKSVLILWGKHDEHLSTKLATPPKKWVPNAKVKLLEAGHWMQYEIPHKLTKEIMLFLN